MKGYTKDGKFHPINPYNKVRKSRDQKVKQQGIIIRKQRNQLKVISNLPSTRLDDYTPKQLEDLMRKRANTTDFGESMGKEGDQHVMDGKHFISTDGEIFGNGKLFHNNYVENSLRDEEGNVHWNGNMQGWILSTGMVRVRADVKNDFLELELPEKLTSSQIKTIREHIEVHNLGRDEISIDDRSKDYSATRQLGLRLKRTTKGGRPIKKWVAFSPSSSEAGEWWTSDKLHDLKWIIQDETLTEDTPISPSNNNDGHFFYGSLEIYDTKRHPKLLEEMETGDWDSE